MGTNTDHFEKLLRNKSTVDNLVGQSVDPERIKKYTFSELFPLLFDNPDGTQRQNISSFFEYLCNSFEWDLTNCSLNETNAARQICERFEIPQNSHVHKLLAFLCKIYAGTTLGEDVRANIFQFMTDFPMKNTKVVFMFNEPSEKYPALGRALHGANVQTVWRVFDFLNEELDLIDSFNKSDCKLAISTAKLETYKNCCNFQGWINQGVLLINSDLTYEEKQERTGTWEGRPGIWNDFTSAIIDGVSQLTKKVFLMSGWRNNQNTRRLIYDGNSNLALDLYHPTAWNPDRIEYKWEHVLPFTNANFFLYQHEKDLIDWCCISNAEKVNAKRQEALVAFFKYVLNELEMYQNASNGFIKLINNGNVTLDVVKASNGFWKLERSIT